MAASEYICRRFKIFKILWGKFFFEICCPTKWIVFTKLTKPPIACLRIEGVIVAIYIDDIIVIGRAYQESFIGTN